jgi:hypothetical protein
MEQQVDNIRQSHPRWRQISSRLLMVLGVVFTVVPTLTVAARGPGIQPPTNANAFMQPNRPAGRFVNLNQAIRIAQEESSGQVLSAKSVRGPDGAQRHRIRVLVDGERVTTMVVDQQGRLLRRP